MAKQLVSVQASRIVWTPVELLVNGLVNAHSVLWQPVMHSSRFEMALMRWPQQACESSCSLVVVSVMPKRLQPPTNMAW
jgi:hypothetical protein